jgi:hypothetical protein
LILSLNVNQKRLSDGGWLMFKALTRRLIAHFHVRQSRKGALEVWQQIVGIAGGVIFLSDPVARRYGSWH